MMSWIIILGIWFALAAWNASRMKRRAELAPKPMTALELRATERFVNNDPTGERYLELEVQGLIPIDRPRKIGFVASVLDATDDSNWQAVISSIDAFQEPDSLCFQDRNPIGDCNPDQGFTRWVRAGVIPLSHLQPPKSGKRRYALIARIVDEADLPPIRNGFCPEHAGMICARVHFTEYEYVNKGYEEEMEARDEARALAVQLAVAVAFVDGAFADAEGETIKRWMARVVGNYDEGPYQESLKSRLNLALRDAFDLATNGELAISDLTARLRDIGPTTQKLACLELCFDVAAAGGTSTSPEVALARLIASAIGVEPAELERIQDQRLVTSGATVSTEAGIETLLGIDPLWDVAQVKAYLRTEFQKWNNRLTTLADANERANAQRMLDMISEARTKYG